MENVVNQILEIDRQAKEITSQADIYQQQAQQDLEKEKQDMLQKYTAQCKQFLEKYTNSEKKHYTEKMQNVEKLHAEFLQQLNRSFEQNRSQWEERIFQDVIK